MCVCVFNFVRHQPTFWTLPVKKNILNENFETLKNRSQLVAKFYCERYPLLKLEVREFFSGVFQLCFSQIASVELKPSCAHTKRPQVKKTLERRSWSLTCVQLILTCASELENVFAFVHFDSEKKCIRDRRMSSFLTCPKLAFCYVIRASSHLV